MLIGDRRFVGDQCVWYIENRKKNHTILLSNNSPTLLADASYSIVVSDGWSADGAVINPVILSDTTPQLVKSIYSLSDKIRVHFKPDGNFQRLHSWTVSEVIFIFIHFILVGRLSLVRIQGKVRSKN